MVDGVRRWTAAALARNFRVGAASVDSRRLSVRTHARTETAPDDAFAYKAIKYGRTVIT